MSTLYDQLAQKKKQIAEQSGRRQRPAKPPMGTSRWRILPSWRGAKNGQFWHDFGQHFIKDASGAMLAVYVCVEKTYGKPCSVCDGVAEGVALARSDDMKKLISEAKSAGRVLVNARNEKGEVELLELSPTTFDKALDIAINNKDESNPDFNVLTDPNEGVDITITRTGTGKNTEYSVTAVLKGSKPVSPELLAKMTNLDEYVAQEYEAGLTKALGAVSKVAALTRSSSAVASGSALPSPNDKEFSNDVPDFPSSKDVIEGDFTVDNESVGMPDDELEDLLNGLDD